MKLCDKICNKLFVYVCTSLPVHVSKDNDDAHVTSVSLLTAKCAIKKENIKQILKYAVVLLLYIKFILW